MYSFGNISDGIDDLTNINDENENKHINNTDNSGTLVLKLNLLNYINNDFNSNNSMEIDSPNNSKSNSYVDETYFKKHEQLNEVKIKLYYILSLDFSLTRGTCNNYFTFLYEGNIVKAKRLIIQNFSINNNNITYDDKEYIFIPAYEDTFNYNNNKIKLNKKKNKRYIMKFNQEILLDKNQFIESFANPEIKNLVKNELEKVYNKKSEKKSNKENEINTSENSSLSHMTTTDDSEKEVDNGIQYYKINKENNFSRFIFTEYIKEIDGIFTEHKRINLYNDPKVDLIDGINNINNIGNDKNDLKCTIIYKNFVGSIIEENEPIILEIKKGFRIIDLLNQIKQNCKIFKRFECDKPIKMPKIAIGIICTNFNPNYKEQLDMLKANYKFEYNGKKLNYFEHITNRFEQNNFKVMIGVYRDSKIYDYPLNIEDYNIKEQNLSKRVDIYYMNEAAKIYKSKDELENIEINLKKQFKSLSYMKTVPIGEHKQKLKAKDEILMEHDNLLKNILLKIENKPENEEIKKMIVDFENSKKIKKDK